MLSTVILNDFGEEVLHMTSADAAMYNDKTDGLFVVCDAVRNGYRFNAGAKVARHFTAAMACLSGSDGIYDAIEASVAHAFAELEKETHTAGGLLEQGVSMAICVVYGGCYTFTHMGERCRLYLKRRDGAFYKDALKAGRFKTACLSSGAGFGNLTRPGNRHYAIAPVENGDRLLMCTQEVAECLGTAGIEKLMGEKDLDGAGVMSEIVAVTDHYAHDAHSALFVETI